MKRLVTTLTVLSAFVAVNAQASTADIDALVEKVRQEALLEASHDQERIERFLAEQDSQAQLLEDADPAAGFIALQHWGEGTVMFRNISLRVR